MKSNGMTAATELFEAPTVAEICKKLDEKIPREVISKRKAGGTKTLDYLEGWYVEDRMNKVFGHLNWNSEIKELTLLPETEYPAYRCVIRLTVTRPDGTQVYRDGVGWGSDKSDNNPHEMAVKEAETDALKRAAKKFGMSMGLALYDKSQENVDEGNEGDSAESGGTAAAAPAAAQGAKRAGKSETKAPEKSANSVVPEKAPEERTLTNRLIGHMAEVAIKRRKVSMADLKAHLAEHYKAGKKEELNDEQAAEFYGYLRGIINE